MNDYFEYYTLTLRAGSPVFVGSGVSAGKKEFCCLKNEPTVRIMDMEKLINYIVNTDKNPKHTEWFEKFMIDDHSLIEDTQGIKRAQYAESCFKTGLNDFLNLIEMPKDERKKCMKSEITNVAAFKTSALDDTADSPCEIQLFSRHKDGTAYIPGSSVKGMIKTALLQHLIRNYQNKDSLPDYPPTFKYDCEIERLSKSERKNYFKEIENKLKNEANTIDTNLINTLELKRNDDGKPVVKDAINSIMRGISISDSLPLSNDSFTICRKMDLFIGTNKNGTSDKNELNVARECLRPGKEAVFRIKIDKRYFRPLGDTVDFEKLFSDMTDEYSKEYTDFYIDHYPNFRDSVNAPKQGFLILGGGSGFYSKNTVYTRHGFIEGTRRISGYMKKHRVWSKKQRRLVMTNPNDEMIHKISPHTLKLTEYNDQYYHFGICYPELEKGW